MPVPTVTARGIVAETSGVGAPVLSWNRSCGFAMRAGGGEAVGGDHAAPGAGDPSSLTQYE
ncbi:hypothetical protein ACH4U3_12850 [Streptomyces griseoruber]|uniref:hypothetical protein n=1 Tax=Streptomyces griseoruber TaxID=1943 RepID=UPI000B329BBA